MQDHQATSMRCDVPDCVPEIPTLSAGVRRPRWSVMIPVYNCAHYLSETLESVLVQDPGPADMQIEVVDDASTDADVRGLVQRMAGSRVQYHVQERNVGNVRNFNTCLQRAQGRLVHLLHGDDLVRPGFYRKQEALFTRFPGIGAAFTRFGYIDAAGRSRFLQDPEAESDTVLDNWLLRLCEKQRIQYAAMVVRRDVYEEVGGFFGVEYGEDWEMWARIAARFPVAYSPDVLAAYRTHPESISARAGATARNMECLDWVMQRIHAWIPEAQRRTVGAVSRRFYALCAIRTATGLWTRCGDRKGAHAQARAAWTMRRDAAVLYQLMKLYTRMTLKL